jgi:hypothetical protein
MGTDPETHATKFAWQLELDLEFFFCVCLFSEDVLLHVCVHAKGAKGLWLLALCYGTEVMGDDRWLRDAEGKTRGGVGG